MIEDQNRKLAVTSGFVDECFELKFLCSAMNSCADGDKGYLSSSTADQDECSKKGA